MEIILTYTTNKQRYSLVRLKNGDYAFRKGNKIFAKYSQHLFSFHQIDEFFRNDVDYIVKNNVDINLFHNN